MGGFTGCLQSAISLRKRSEVMSALLQGRRVSSKFHEKDASIDSEAQMGPMRAGKSSVN